MSFQIKYGLFKLDVDDYYAILGLPINAEPKEVRPRYLKIVQKLHPDTSRIDEGADKKLANEILSKLVNPAYETLSKEANRKEYQLLLSETGRSLAFNSSKSTQMGEIENDLRRAGVNFEKVYRKMIESLAMDQFDSLQDVIKKISQLSELNLIYLKVRPDLEDLVKARAKIAVSKQRAAEQESQEEPVAVRNTDRNIPVQNSPTQNISAQNTPVQNAPRETPAQKPPVGLDKEIPSPRVEKQEEVRLSPVATYLKRAEEMVEKNNLDRAILDLKDALKLEPDNGSCHGLIGLAYLRLGQMGMAKVHIKKAIQLSPRDAFANKAQQELDQLSAKAKADTSKGKQKQGKDSNTGKDSKDKKDAPTIFGIRLW